MNSRPNSLVEQSFKVLFWDYVLSIPMVLYYLLFFLILSTTLPDLDKVTWEMLKPKLPFFGALWVLLMFLQLTCSHMVHQLIGHKKKEVDIGLSLNVALKKGWVLFVFNLILFGLFLTLILVISSIFKGPTVLVIVSLVLMLCRIVFDMLPGLLLSSDFNALSLLRFWVFSWRYHARRFFQIILFLMAVSFLVLIVSSQLGAIPGFGNSILVPVWLGVSSTWILILWVLFFQDIRVNVKV